MLIALLLQASFTVTIPSNATQAEVQAALKAASEAARTRCGQYVIEAMAPFTGPAQVEGATVNKPRVQARPEARPWRPGENRDEGYYAAVNRMVDGCPVPTPIYLPNAPSPAGKR